MLVFGHACDQCGFIGTAVPLTEGFIGCPECGVIEDVDMDVDVLEFSNSL